MRKRTPFKSSISTDFAYIGERIEDKVERVTTNGEPIEAISPIIYTDRAEGVKAEYDIRTDRWEVAQGAMDIVSKNRVAKRDSFLKIDKPNDGESATDKSAEK